MATNSSAWKSMPVAPRETRFDFDDAVARILHWADGDTTKFAKAFLWHNPNADKGSADAYRLPIADVAGNRLVLIPRAVFSAATILSGAHGGLEDVTSEQDRLELKGIVTDIYDMLREEYSDPRVKPPWLRGGNEESQVTASMEEDEYFNALTASVNSAGWGSVPIAEDVHRWNSSEARSRVWQWADGNFRQYRKAFLWYDASVPELKSSYKLPIADIINGKLTIVPNAVNAVAAVLGGARGGVDIPDADMNGVERVVKRIQARMHSVEACGSCGGDDQYSKHTEEEVLGCADCEDDDEKCELAGDDITACGSCAGKRSAREVIEAAFAAPPIEAFTPPQVDGPTPLTVTADGRVYGHAWLWNKCHAGIQNECVIAPKSKSGYKYFLNGQVLTSSGQMVRVGKITMGTGHAGPRSGWIPAADHYDNTGTQAAWVTVVEDRFGGMVAGIVTPQMTPEQIAVLRASPISGDWRLAGGSLELVAALAVNTPGFPIVASANGQVTSICAAGVLMPDGSELHKYEEPQLNEAEQALVDRLDKLDARIDAVLARGRARIYERS